MALVFALSFAWQPLFFVAQMGLLVAFFAMAWDGYQLLKIGRQSFDLQRTTPKILSLGDVEEIYLQFRYQADVPFSFQIFDELPHQLQIREFHLPGTAEGTGQQRLKYTIVPKKRGLYVFGNLVLMVRHKLGFFDRRFEFERQQEVPVYPSIIQLKKFQLLSVPQQSQQFGLKKMRRIGHSYEFEQIKNYVSGDDYRSVNWKSTSRFNQLMVNQFQDEKSQSIYCVIDKGRQMRAAFDGLSLLDYAINASLVLSSTALQKNDRAGLITFKENIDTTLKAEAGAQQRRKIFEALYRETESSYEANYELLYRLVRQVIRSRSLLFLFTNIDNEHALDRWMPLFKSIAKMHLLVLVVFENAPLVAYGAQPAHTVQDVYMQLAAQQQIYDQRKMVLRLRQAGIQVILTPPEQLTVNAINKYLELKARGMI